MPDSVSPAAARRIALAAQGFGRPRPASVGTRQLNLLTRRMRVLQLDSVNVFERSHYLPAFARLGRYDKADLDRALFDRRGDYTEYWAHVAAVIPVEDWGLFRWRMADMRAKYGKAGGWTDSHPEIVDWVRTEVARRGRVRASELEHESGKGAGGWWGWSAVKEALEYLWLYGELVTAGRDRFERSYALPESRLPASVLNAEITRPDAQRALVEKAVAAIGIGTRGDIADVYRMRDDDTKARLRELVEEGSVVQVTVPGWRQPAFMAKDTVIPRQVTAAALLSPFDPIVWERERTLRMFDFHYRIEIYTPAPQRQFGYYTLPVLVDDAIVGRIDLKNDRQNHVLRVQSAWREPHAPAGIEQRIVPLLEEIGVWQDHERVEFTGRGDLAAELEGAWRSR